jgi:hypothetical protein
VPRRREPFLPLARLWHEKSPAKIKRVSPDAKILISLRDPVARAYSAFWLLTRHRRERRPFLEVITGERANPPAPGEPPPLCSGWSFYNDGLARYLDTFGDNVRVLIFEEFVAEVKRLE